MKNKKLLFGALLFTAVGIAAVSTNLIMNMSTKISPNTDDYDVYFSQAKVNGVVDNSVITDTDTITFAADLSAIGDTYTLDYTVRNSSRNYDSDIVVSCTEDTDYLSISNTFDTSSSLAAQTGRDGKLLIQLKKSYAGDSNLSQTVTCTLDTNAVERTQKVEN